MSEYIAPQLTSIERDSIPTDTRDSRWIIAGLLDQNRELENLLSDLERDKVTGLLNWSVVYRKIKSEGTRGSLLWIDMSNLKLINDLQGRPHGNKMLKDAGKIISNSVDKRDSVSRTQGDEFPVVVYTEDPHTKLSVAARIIRSFGMSNAHNGVDYKTVPRIGLVDFHSDNLDEQIQMSDKLMQSVKFFGVGVAGKREDFSKYSTGGQRVVDDQIFHECHIPYERGKTLKGEIVYSKVEFNNEDVEIGIWRTTEFEFEFGEYQGRDVVTKVTERDPSVIPYVYD